MANRRNVKRSTVMGYVHQARVNMEKALSAALRSEMLEEQFTALRMSYNHLRKTIREISPEPRRSSRRRR